MCPYRNWSGKLCFNTKLISFWICRSSALCRSLLFLKKEITFKIEVLFYIWCLLAFSVIGSQEDTLRFPHGITIFSNASFSATFLPNYCYLIQSVRMLHALHHSRKNLQCFNKQKCKWKECRWQLQLWIHYRKQSSTCDQVGEYAS